MKRFAPLLLLALIPLTVAGQDGYRLTITKELPTGTVVRDFHIVRLPTAEMKICVYKEGLYADRVYITLSGRVPVIVNPKPPRETP